MESTVGLTGQLELTADEHRPAVGPQLTAFFTSAAILASSAAVSSVSAKAVGHMAPSSRFALSLKPSVAYLRLELCRGLEEADDVAVLGVRGHPVPGSRREVWRGWP